jgi:hypothetical protein
VSEWDDVYSTDTSSSVMTISMPRGDIRPVYFSVRNNDEEQTMYEGAFDEIYFTVKTAFNKNEYLFQKRLSTGEIELTEDGDYQFVIEPDDTDGLKFGKYVFDIELIAGSDIKQTFVGELTLTDEATHRRNEG